MKKLILKRLKCYTADNTDLAVRILNIYHEDDEGIIGTEINGTCRGDTNGS